MIRVDFAYGADHRIWAACRTAARHVQARRRLVVYCTDAPRLQRFDQLLWSFDPISFITHTRADDPIAARAAVVLAHAPGQLNGISHDGWLLNLDLACPPADAGFERILEIVSENATDKTAARQRWVEYQHAGFTLRGHRLQEVK